MYCIYTSLEELQGQRRLFVFTFEILLLIIVPVSYNKAINGSQVYELTYYIYMSDKPIYKIKKERINKLMNTCQTIIRIPF